MRVLVGCEFSQIVTTAFRDAGHEAYSCDLLPTEGRKEWHIQDNVLDHLNDSWDLAIFHPPCTYLAVCANRSFLNNPDRWEKRLDAVKFVHFLMNCDIPKICTENPVGVISTHIRKPDQYIQPYEYGHTDSKKTGLWLKSLPLLEPTNIVSPEWITAESGKRYSKTAWYCQSSNNSENAKTRSRTYQGIADAMADQWG